MDYEVEYSITYPDTKINNLNNNVKKYINDQKNLYESQVIKNEESIENLEKKKYEFITKSTHIENLGVIYLDLDI